MTAKKRNLIHMEQKDGEIRRNVEEDVKVESHWQIVGDGVPPHKCGKDYRYIDELVGPVMLCRRFVSQVS